MPRERLDELVDFLLGIVKVRAGAEAAFADSDHQTMLGLQVLLNLTMIVHV